MANINIFGTIHNVTGEPAVEAYQSYDNVESTSELGRVLELESDSSVDQHTINEALAANAGGQVEENPMAAQVAEPYKIEGYRQLLYIESDGNQYIDTGVIPTVTTGFEVDFNCSDPVIASNSVQIFNAGGRGNTPHYAVSMYKGSNILGAITIGDSGDISANITSGVRQYIKYISNGSQTVIRADGTTTTITATTVNVTNSIYLFAMHEGSNATRRAIMKLYGFKLYNGTELIHNYIPMQRLSDNEIGVYDTVGELFYTNSGTGAFTGEVYNTLSRFSQLIIDSSLNPDKYKSRIETLEAEVEDLSGSVLKNDINVTEDVGGIDSGKQYEEGTTLEQILREMLNPTLYPDLIAPSATLSADSDLVLEDGTSKQVTFTVTFDKGKIHPLYGTEPLADADRSGYPGEYKLNDEEYQNSNTFTNVSVDEDHKTFTANVKYSASSIQPKDSTGANYDSPLAAGDVNSNTLTFVFTNTVWANTSDITDIRKIAPTTIKYSDKKATFEFPACTISNPEVFEVPESWTIASIESPNAFIANVWDDVAFEFSTSSTTHLNASGETVNYVRYTFNKGIDMDGRKIKITWN